MTLEFDGAISFELHIGQSDYSHLEFKQHFCEFLVIKQCIALKSTGCREAVP